MSSREQMASRRPSSALAGRSRGGWQAAPPGRLLPQHSQPFRVACKKLAPKQNKKSDSGRWCPREGGNSLRAGGGAGRREGGKTGKLHSTSPGRRVGWAGITGSALPSLWRQSCLVFPSLLSFWQWRSFAQPGWKREETTWEEAPTGSFSPYPPLAPAA